VAYSKGIWLPSAVPCFNCS